MFHNSILISFQKYCPLACPQSASGNSQFAAPTRSTSHLHSHPPSVSKPVSHLTTQCSFFHLQQFLPRDAMHKRGLCRHAVSVCPSVRLSVCHKTNKHVFEIFSLSGSHTILVFPNQTGWRYSDWNPPNGYVECRWGRQKCDSGRIHGCIGHLYIGA